MRSLLFTILFYLCTVFWAIFILLLGLFGQSRAMRWGISRYCAAVLFWLRVIVGIKVEVRNAELLKREGAYLICAKHMSDIDAIITFTMAPKLTALAKKELFSLPLIGWIIKAIGIIKIDRKAGNAHHQMPDVIKTIREQGMPLIVYPEGTRSRVGERKKLKSGIYHLQESGKLDVITVATNSGYHWPKGTFVKRPGTIVAEMHGPLPKGLPKDQMMALVHKNVIERSEEIMAEVDGVAPPNTP